MKICVLSGITHKAGGLFYAVNSLCKGLNRQGCAVSVVGREDDVPKEAMDAWGALPVAPYKAYGPLGSSLKLRNLLKISDADVVHQHGIWMDDQWAALQWQKKTGRPVVVSPHGMLDPWAVRNSAWKKKLVGLIFANESLHKATCIHALCQSEADSIRAYGLENPIAIIPNGIDLPDFDHSMRKVQCSKKKRKLLFLGRIHPKKGLKELIAAWSMVPEACRNEWELIIAGWDDGGHLDSLKKQASTLGLQWSVDELDSELCSAATDLHFVGPKFGEEKYELLRSSEAFILPSFSEGLPMSVLEAWAHALPVLMTPQCNIPEGFAMGSAIKIEPNPDDVGAGLLTLFSMNDADRVQMGQMGLRMVKEKFTWAKIAAEMHAVYQWILGRAQAPDCVRFD